VEEGREEAREEGRPEEERDSMPSKFYKFRGRNERGKEEVRR